ncbi:unnamed protein product [Cylindrotheca closterium]|uniref:Uncharacterized protein n=1 Tax=Cylindrotheca closterium TaxID=2856 RepID=A0AAD2CKQ1_9STRA|nr:unnamed protein product [Cylindrotheca closterium]
MKHVERRQINFERLAKWQDTFRQQKGTIEEPNITLQVTKILSDNVQISKQKDVDVDAEVTVIVKTLPIHPIQTIRIKELRIKDIAILQDLKATIKDDLLETVLRPKDMLERVLDT